MFIVSWTSPEGDRVRCPWDSLEEAFNQIRVLLIRKRADITITEE